MIWKPLFVLWAVIFTQSAAMATECPELPNSYEDYSEIKALSSDLIAVSTKESLRLTIHNDDSDLQLIHLSILNNCSELANYFVSYFLTKGVGADNLSKIKDGVHRDVMMAFIMERNFIGVKLLMLNGVNPKSASKMPIIIRGRFYDLDALCAARLQTSRKDKAKKAEAEKVLELIIVEFTRDEIDEFNSSDCGKIFKEPL